MKVEVVNIRILVRNTKTNVDMKIVMSLSELNDVSLFW
jgi:hypothetical protein